MKLETIAQNHISKLPFAPLAIEQNGGAVQRKNELDPSCLNVAYFDQTHQCHLPLFAASSVKVSGGCQLTETLDPTTRSRRVDSPNGGLASYLAQPTAFTAAHEKAKPRLTDKVISAYILVGAGIIPGAIVASSDPLTTTWLAEAIANWITVTLLIAMPVMGLIALFQEKVETSIYNWLLPKTPENYRRQSTAYSKTFTALLPGNIPQKIRNTILEGLNFYKDVHLVWEAREQWGSDGIQPEKIPNLDPLVFGETQDGKFILLAKFDLTPLEETIGSKFIH